MITWTNLKVIIRALISESATEMPDATLLAAMNAALLAIYGDLVVVSTPTAITVATGNNIYDCPDNFLYIEAIWDALGNRLPDYAWEVRAGGGGTAPKIVFGVGFTPTTGQNPTVTGWQAKTIKPTGKTLTKDWIAIATADTDEFQVDPGWLIGACLTALHGSAGGTASDLADWHKLEAGETRHAQRALVELKEQLTPTIPPAYRPTPGARLVPGRGE